MLYTYAMLYTRKGDAGTTKTFDSKPGERISKSSCRTESLGALDELNSFLGLVKVKAQSVTWTVNESRPEDIVMWVQNSLFIVQAEVAGFPKKMMQNKVVETEKITDAAEKELPPITTFFISGGTEMAALFDVARTLARKAERRVIAAHEEGSLVIGAATLAFLNRLSSLLYALARLSNHKSGIKEVSPSY